MDKTIGDPLIRLSISAMPCVRKALRNPGGTTKAQKREVLAKGFGYAYTETTHIHIEIPSRRLRAFAPPRVPPLSLPSPATLTPLI